MASNLEDYYKPGHHPFYVRRSFLLEKEPLPHRSANNRKYYTAIGRKRRQGKEQLTGSNASITRTFPRRRHHPDLREVFIPRVQRRHSGNISRLGDNLGSGYKEYWKRSTSNTSNQEDNKIRNGRSPPRTPLVARRAQFTRQVSHISRSSSDRIPASPVSISTFYPLSSSIPRPQRTNINEIGRQATDPLPQGAQTMDGLVKDDTQTNDPLHRSSHFPSFLSETMNREKMMKLDRLVHQPYYYKLPIHHNSLMSSLRGPQRASFGAMSESRKESITTYEGKFSVLHELHPPDKAGYDNNAGQFSDDFFSSGRPGMAGFYASQNRRTRPHVKDIFTEKWVRYHHRSSYGYFENSDDNNSSIGSDAGDATNQNDIDIRITEKTHVPIGNSDYFGNTSSSSNGSDGVFYNKREVQIKKMHFDPHDFRADDDPEKRLTKYEDEWSRDFGDGCSTPHDNNQNDSDDIEVTHTNIPIHQHIEPSFYRPTRPGGNPGGVVMYIHDRDGEGYVEYQPDTKPSTETTFTIRNSFRRKLVCALIAIFFVVSLVTTGVILALTVFADKPDATSPVAAVLFNISSNITTPGYTTVTPIVTTTRPKEIVIVVDGSVRVINIPYTEKLSDKSSQQYNNRSKEFCDEIGRGYRVSDLKDLYRTCVVNKFSNGSLITQFTVELDSPIAVEITFANILQTLRNTMSSSTIYEADLNSISIKTSTRILGATEPPTTTIKTTVATTTASTTTETTTTSTTSETTTEEQTTVELTTTATTVPPTTTTYSTTTSGEFACDGKKKNGFYPDPLNCTRYYSCISGIPYQRYCGINQMWKQGAFSCVTYNATACQLSTLLPTTTETEMTTFLPTTTTLREPRTTTEFQCQSSGLFPDPQDCTRFFSCQSGLEKMSFVCPANRYWVQADQNCREAHFVGAHRVYPPGCKGSDPVTTVTTTPLARTSATPPLREPPA